MMGITESLLFYGVIGIAVAAALLALPDQNAGIPMWTTALSAVLFWPIYLPLLLSPKPGMDSAASPPESVAPDELHREIACVERELKAAVAGLQAEHVHSSFWDDDRIQELHTAWMQEAARIREMDAILANSETANSSIQSPAEHTAAAQWEHSRLENLERLRDVRNRANDAFTATLARVRELISQLHLAHFTGASATRADELLSEIAASLESDSEVAQWRPEAERTEKKPAGLAGGL
jgi:hypothetical protein